MKLLADSGQSGTRSSHDNRQKDILLRHLRGLGSTLTGLAFLLVGGWWMGKMKRLLEEARREKGYVLVLPGIEGKSTLNFNIVRGLIDGGVSSAIEIYDWTTGFWPLFLYHLRYSQRAHRQAALVAEKIQTYQAHYPGRPTFLVGHSGGGSMVIRALECLPPDRPVTAAVLLGPAVSRGYHLGRALQRTERGIWNFYSPLDLLLTIGTMIVGTADGRHGVAAGAWGFCSPPLLSEMERRLYATRLHQVCYQTTMACRWNFGGHYGWANRVFVADWLSAGMTS